MTVSLNFSGERITVGTNVLNGTDDYEPFMSFALMTEGGNQVDAILPDADTARRIAGALHRAADALDGRVAEYRAARTAKPQPEQAATLAVTF